MSKTIAQTIVQTAAKTLIAGARGSRQCWCQGQLLVMLGHYGWILPMDPVDPVVSAKTDGRIYLNKKDIVGGAQLAEGDMVGFYLYVDEQGLGAEEAQPYVDQASKKSFNAEAAEFVPPPPGMESSWSVDAKLHAMSASANEFVPSQTIAAAPAAAMSSWYKKESNSHKGKFYYINSKTKETSWTKPEDYVEPVQVVSPCKPVGMQSVSAINLAYLSDDSSDDDDTDQDDTPCLPIGKQARQRSLSPTASTSAGLSSDDDSSGDDSPILKELPEACLGGQKFRPPPGLDLPSTPNHLALGVIARAGLSVESDKQHDRLAEFPPLGGQKLPAWRSTRTSKLSSAVSESNAWTARREARSLVAAA